MRSESNSGFGATTRLPSDRCFFHIMSLGRQLRDDLHIGRCSSLDSSIHERRFLCTRKFGLYPPRREVRSCPDCHITPISGRQPDARMSQRPLHTVLDNIRLDPIQPRRAHPYSLPQLPHLAQRYPSCWHDSSSRYTSYGVPPAAEP
jgi:hypothetical protein